MAPRFVGLLLLGAACGGELLVDENPSGEEAVEQELGPSMAAVGVYPSRGSSSANAAVTFVSRYHHANGHQALSTLSIWFDNTRTLTRLAPHAARGQVRRSGNGWTFHGMRYTGGTQTCGIDLEPRHCYKNFAWDVGNHPVGASSWVHFNYDDQVRDTTQATASTIGRYRAKAVREVNATTLDVEWEFSFGPFFKERELEISVGLADSAGNTLYTNDRPYWHQLGTWRVDRALPDVRFTDEFSNGNFPGWGRFGRDGAIFVSGTKRYAGSTSARLSSNAAAQGWQILQKDFGTERQGAVTLWLWDDGTALPEGAMFHVAVSNLPYDQWDQPNAKTVALAFHPSVNASQYVYRGRVENMTGQRIQNPANQWFSTGIARTPGWKKVVFWVTPVGAWAELDDDAKEIFPLNFSTFSSETFHDAQQNPIGRRVAVDADMTGFRYLRLGVSKGGAFYADQVSLADLPPPPNLETAAERDLWTLRGDQLYLDMYEPIGLRGNLEGWTNFHIAQYQGNAARSWWWNILANLARAHYERYRMAGVQFDRDQANKIWRLMLRHYQHWDDSLAGTHAAVSGMSYLKSAFDGWDAMPADLRFDTWRKLAAHYDWFSGRSVPFHSVHIGDSSGEDYAWGPLYGAAGAALYFPGYRNSATWLRRSRQMSMSVFSTDVNTPCAACDSGKVGIKTIYAPGENPQDCPGADPTRSQTCLCPQDRAQVPAGHDFSYLFDNHDYHPHPGYALGALSGPIAAATMFAELGQSVPAEFLHNTRPIWYRHRDFADYRSGRFLGANIYRLRSKYLCDGDDSGEACGPGGACAGGKVCGAAGRCVTIYERDRGPYHQTNDNSFRLTGYDDWGTGASLGPNFFRALRVALAAQGDTTGTQFQGLDLVSHATRTRYWRNFDVVGRSLRKGIVFTTADLSCNFIAPHCLLSPDSGIYVADRINPRHQYEMARRPAQAFNYCEENLVKDQVWLGQPSFDCDTQDRAQGHGALKLSSAAGTDAELYSTLMAVEPSRTYRVDYWVKVQSLVPETSQAYGRILVAQYNSVAKETDAVNQNRLDSGLSLGQNLSGSSGWVQRSYTFTTQAAARYVRFRAPLGLFGTARGTARFDGVTLTRVN